MTRPLRYLSVCSGIEAATVAWKPLGWEPVAFAEIEPFPCAVLAHHYSDVPNLGDMERFHEWPDFGPVDVLVGGSPCQSFSIAGLRKGMDDPRGNLALVFLGLIDRFRPRFVLWENVPGVLSSNGGRDFGSFVGGLGQLGYGWAYRVLDAQYFGLAQRRKRVFVVACPGDWRRAAAVLFERESLRRDTAPRRETGQDFTHDLAPCVGASGRGFERAGETRGQDPVVAVAFGGNRTSGPLDIATAVNAHGGPHGRMDFESETFVAHALRAEGFDASEDGTGRGTPLVPVAYQCQGSNVGEMGTLRGGNGNETGGVPFIASAYRTTGNHDKSHANAGVPPAVAIPLLEVGKRQGEKADKRDGLGVGQDGDPMFTLQAGARHGVAFQETESGVREGAVAGTLRADGPGHDPVGTRVRVGMAVRRLTPRERERLMGFPDDYTLVPAPARRPKSDGGWDAVKQWIDEHLLSKHRPKTRPATDGPRYKALGNSMAVPVIAWIGRRIALMDEIEHELKEAQ